jgi:ubiquinone/menaquinone biosynthesis C-methylase UbiE
MASPEEHTGEHEAFERIWAQTGLFYNEGDVRNCRSFRELWETVKFRRLDEFFPRAPQKTLEVGCGSGGVSLYFHNTRRYETALVDLSDEALAFAHKNFALHAKTPLPRAAFVKADALTLPYAAGAFDMVMSFGLLEHFSDIEQPIAEQLRVLRRGGLLWADIVTRRFSVDTFSQLPGMLKKAIGYALRGRYKDLSRITEADFYENTFSLSYYVETTERLGGKVRFALGNRPVTSVGRLPILSGALLRLYKTDLAQKWWRNFDLSNSRFSKSFGAGWWLFAEKS